MDNFLNQDSCIMVYASSIILLQLTGKYNHICEILNNFKTIGLFSLVNV